MDLLSCCVAGISLALAVLSLVVVWINRTERDLEWKLGCTGALGGVVVAALAIVQGIQSSSEAAKNAARLAKAEGELAAANKALASTTQRLGSRLLLLDEPKVKSLSAGLSSIPNKVPIVFRRASGDLDTHEFALGLLALFRTSGWPVDPMDILSAEVHSPPVAGIRVEWAKDDEAMTEVAVTIANVLSEARIGFVAVDRHPTAPVGKVRIVIGEKPLAHSSREDGAQ